MFGGTDVQHDSFATATDLFATVIQQLTTLNTFQFIFRRPAFTSGLENLLLGQQMPARIADGGRVRAGLQHAVHDLQGSSRVQLGTEVPGEGGATPGEEFHNAFLGEIGFAFRTFEGMDVRMLHGLISLSAAIGRLEWELLGCGPDALRVLVDVVEDDIPAGEVGVLIAIRKSGLRRGLRFDLRSED